MELEPFIKFVFVCIVRVALSCVGDVIATVGCFRLSENLKKKKGASGLIFEHGMGMYIELLAERTNVKRSNYTSGLMKFDITWFSTCDID